MAEFSDRPLTGVPKEDNYHDHFPAKYFTSYLEQYLKDHSYAGSSLGDRIVYGSTVEKLRKQDGQWIASIQGTGATYSAPKVVDATGVTSTPNIPNIQDRDKFKGLAIHHKDFGRSSLLKDSAYRTVTVLGGAKSAADVAYAAAKAGKSVSWIIRKSGCGPAAYVNAGVGSPYKNANESLYNRFISPFLASFFSERTWWVRFLHSTSYGNAMLGKIWQQMNAQALDGANYDRADGKANGYKNLMPDTPVFWENDSSGINQRDDFFDTIAQKVRVFRQDIDRMTEDGLVLKDGTELQTGAVVYATGWQTNFPYLETQTAAEMGLPIKKTEEVPEQSAKWKALEQAADEKILKQFTMLAKPPPYYQSESSTTPFRLYKGALPVHDHSIVFVGKIAVANQFRNAETQALWAVSALDGKLPLPSAEKMESEIASTVAWCRRRYLSKGDQGNWLYWDSVPYTDALLKEVGLRSHRKSFFQDLFAPCVAKDLRGIVAEYKRKYQIEESPEPDVQHVQPKS